MSSERSMRRTHYRSFIVCSALLLALAVGAAWLGVVVLTSEIQPANLISCDNPSDLRCSDNFFFGLKGGQHTLGASLVALAVLAGFVSGGLAVSAARKPVSESVPATLD